MKANRIASVIGLQVGLAALGGALLSGCAGLFGGGEDPRAFTSLDKDGDASVTRDEFSRWGKDEGILNSFMGEGEKSVSEIALSEGLYRLWDVEGSGITEGEWNEGIRAWFPDAGDQVYADWDLDQSGMLDDQEMVAGFAHSDLLRTFDEDNNGQISGTELLSRFYQIFDTDNDEKLNADEWKSGLTRWMWDF